MPAISGLIYLGLSVRDARRSAAWYRELFGMDTVREQLDEAGRGEVLLREPTSGLLIGLLAHPGNEGEPFSEFRTGLDQPNSACRAAKRWRHGWNGWMSLACRIRASSRRRWAR